MLMMMTTENVGFRPQPEPILVQALHGSSWSQDIQSRLPMTVSGGRLQE